LGERKGIPPVKKLASTPLINLSNGNQLTQVHLEWKMAVKRAHVCA